ncbi:hypothetical protein PAP_08020 [Palaeococcus pacificus DY20341]|uniref:KaiC-like domain-containing protein n=1 Tax=Palaeococcus pacificus DY20341 TaxID=1343739 RepID=A0A075LZH4_9EURY|nr:hypothetical protein PAP_08020 [Palaeococcus pacificus DY20341]
MEIVKTGLSEIDSALGGGLVNRGNLLIAYDRRSLGWLIGIKIFKSIVEDGAMGVILNTTLPISKLELRASYVGLDIQKEGEAGNLYIIDLFGSKYRIPDERHYIIQIEDWSDDTGISKLINIYYELASKLSKDALIVGLVATIEGIYHEFGKEVMDRIIRASLASFEKEPLKSLRINTISLLNKEAVPEYVSAWLYSLNDQIIEFVSQMGPVGLQETILIPKSLIPSFRPRHYTIKLSEEHFIQLF